MYEYNIAMLQCYNKRRWLHFCCHCW